MLSSMWRNWNPCAFLVEMQNDAAALDKSIVVSQKMKYKITT